MYSSNSSINRGWTDKLEKNIFSLIYCHSAPNPSYGCRQECPWVWYDYSICIMFVSAITYWQNLAAIVKFLARCEVGLGLFLRRNWYVRPTTTISAPLPLHLMPSRTVPISSSIHPFQSVPAVGVCISTSVVERLRRPRRLGFVSTYTECITYLWWWCDDAPPPRQ